MNRFLLIGLLAVLALPGTLAASAPSEVAPAPEVSLEEVPEEGVPVVAVEDLDLLAGAVEAGITPYNPCYQFDNPQTGCYYSWRPSDLCCINPDPRCPSICY